MGIFHYEQISLKERAGERFFDNTEISYLKLTQDSGILQKIEF